MNLSGFRTIDIPTVYCVLYKKKLRCVFTNLKAAEEALLGMKPLYRKKKQKNLVVQSFFLRESAHDTSPYNTVFDEGCLYNNINLETLQGGDATDTSSWTDLSGEVVVPRKLGWDGGKEIEI